MKIRVAHRLMAFALFCVFSSSFLVADDTLQVRAQVEALMKGAREMGEAFNQSDAAKLVERTYPPVIEMMGGREKAIKAIGDGMKSMKAIVSDLDYKVADPKPFQTEAKKLFAVVPTTLEMTIKNTGRVRSKGYLLGVSEDQGKTWTYLDGSGLKSKKERQKVLPEVHEKLKLPDWEPPQIIQPKDL